MGKVSPQTTYLVLADIAPWADGVRDYRDVEVSHSADCGVESQVYKIKGN